MIFPRCRPHQAAERDRSACGLRSFPEATFVGALYARPTRDIGLTSDLRHSSLPDDLPLWSKPVNQLSFDSRVPPTGGLYMPGQETRMRRIIAKRIAGWLGKLSLALSSDCLNPVQIRISTGGASAPKKARSADTQGRLSSKATYIGVAQQPGLRGLGQLSSPQGDPRRGCRRRPGGTP